MMTSFPLLFLLLAATDVLAFLNFAIENASPLPENASEHTLFAIITVSASRHASLVGDPVIINANPAVHPFVLSRRTTYVWELFTTGVPKLDFEMVALYSLSKDSQGTTVSQTIVIQIADVNEPPAFIGSLAQVDQVTEIYILEDTAPGTVIYRTAAKDPEDAVLEYFISPESSAFTIDSIGTISTAAVFDFESEARSFSLVIEVVDPGGLFTAGNLKIFLINVNNKDPILSCSLFNIENAALSATPINSTLHKGVNITLDEEIPIGKTVRVCQATDEDNLGYLTFDLDPGNVYFTVDKELGTVVTSAHPDVERAGFVSVQFFSIEACDLGQLCATIPVTAYIHGINDNSPFCDQYLIRYTGKEVIAKGIVVAKLLCHDLDEPPDTLHFIPSLGPIGSGQLFEQVPGAENSIQVTKQLDYENPEMVAAGHIYEMMNSVFDDLYPSHTATVTVVVEVIPANDFSPVFKPAHYSFSVLETSGALESPKTFLIQKDSGKVAHYLEGKDTFSFFRVVHLLDKNEPYKMLLAAFYKVGRVTAIDEDHLPNCMTYKITNGDIQVIQRFWIHPLSGMIELTTQPDYESVKQYNLTVEAVDCDRFQACTAMTTVTVDTEDENDEAPVCMPSLYKAVIFDNVVAGTNVNGFQLSCHDRDSQDFEMCFEIVSGYENHHFGFDPTRGSNIPKLTVKNPFHFESGAELQWQYHLVVHIIDDNLKYGKATKPRTGTAVIDIYVTRASTPPPSTANSEQRKGLTILYTAINTYKSSDWYIPFIFTLMAVFFAVLVAWVCFLLWRYGKIKECGQKMAKEVSKPKPKGMMYIAGDKNQKENPVTGNRNKKLEILTEVIVYETVFDGEAIDPDGMIILHQETDKDCLGRGSPLSSKTLAGSTMIIWT